MKQTAIPKQACPYCGYEFDTSASVYCSASPKPGDISICLNCAKVAVFDKDLTQRLPTAEEKEQINKNRKILDAQLAIACVDKPDLR